MTETPSPVTSYGRNQKKSNGRNLVSGVSVVTGLPLMYGITFWYFSNLASRGILYEKGPFDFQLATTLGPIRH